MPVAIFGIDGRLVEPGRQPAAPRPRRRLALACLLDLRRRTRRVADPVLVGTATAASLIPFIGTIVYTILRPPEFLDDARERELETQASELRVRQLTAQSCPHCEHPIERS